MPGNPSPIAPVSSVSLAQRHGVADAGAGGALQEGGDDEGVVIGEGGLEAARRERRTVEVAAREEGDARVAEEHRPDGDGAKPLDVRAKAVARRRSNS